LDLINTGVKTIAMLFLVLGLLVCVLYFMKRFLFKGQDPKGNVFIKVVSSLHLSPKEKIQVIEVSGETIVLGITPGNISFLTKVGPAKGSDIETNEQTHGNAQTHSKAQRYDNEFERN
jgi:flagellar biosynthetic protein FliO